MIKKNVNKESFSVFEVTKSWCQKHRVDFEANELTGSTNENAGAEAPALLSGLKVYLADLQSKGRGRGDHRWNNSTPGSALLITYSYFLSSCPQPIASPLVGLAVYETLKNVFSPKNLSIKAPNDIFLEDKKILGLLIETVKSGDHFRLLIGLGLNVFSSPDTIETASHLAHHLELLSRPLTAKNWELFLDQLMIQFNQVARDVLGSHLSEQQRENLLKALNDWPHLPDKYLSVSPFCDLTTAKRTISWREL